MKARRALSPLRPCSHLNNKGEEWWAGLHPTSSGIRPHTPHPLHLVSPPPIRSNTLYHSIHLHALVDSLFPLLFHIHLAGKPPVLLSPHG